MRRRTSKSGSAPDAKPKVADPEPDKKGSAKDRARAALSPNVKNVADDTEVSTLPELELPEKLGDVTETRVSKLTMTGFETVVDNLFTFDPEATYEQVKDCLELGQRASRTDYGSLVDALDAAEENARKALQLVANAKVALVSYKADVEVITAQIHTQSAREIQEAYEDPDNQEVTKKPTVADVEAWKTSNYHDEYADCRTRLEKAKRTVEYLEGLAGIVGQRARDLRQMCASARGA